MWHVERDETVYTVGNPQPPTGLVLVAADYELLSNTEAVKLARSILDVASERAYYVAQDGTRFETRAEFEARP